MRTGRSAAQGRSQGAPARNLRKCHWLKSKISYSGISAEVELFQGLPSHGGVGSLNSPSSKMGEDSCTFLPVSFGSLSESSKM